MKNYYISVNQFAEFSSGTAATKKRIIKQQVNPNKFLLPWYQTARSAMKKYFKDVNNSTPLDNAIEILASRKNDSKRKQIDQRVSIEALNELKAFAFPTLLRDVEFEIIKPDIKNIVVNNVNIIVAPDVVLKAVYDGNVIYGAIKIHICKSKPFDENQSKYVAGLILKYLNNTISKADGIVLPELCLCLDIFGGRITPASVYTSKLNSEIRTICEELKFLWAA